MSKSSRFAIVVSEFNAEITESLLQGALSRLQGSHVPSENITVVKVPGAIEIPLMAKLLAKRKKFDAIICLGAIIRGETSHYDYVCTQVSTGCQAVMMAFEVPVIFGILTTENVQQAQDRIGGKEGHKGMEAADAAMKMVALIEQV